jgi:hypothetical protein
VTDAMRNRPLAVVRRVPRTARMHHTTHGRAAAPSLSKQQKWPATESLTPGSAE